MKSKISEALKAGIKSLFRGFGFDLVKYRKYPVDFPISYVHICDYVKPYTMTNPERVYALIEAVNYLVRNKIEGAIVECGVWKGGSMMAAARTLLEAGDVSRDLYLYDTFSGMSAPSAGDVSQAGEAAVETFTATLDSRGVSKWFFSPLEEVRKNLYQTGYPKDKIHFIQGKVEDTLPGTAPGEIALLRLDTDWYESTKHELVHLFPLLKTNGVILIDDYGFWKGSQRAVDEYFSENNIRLLLNRIDDTGRMAIKGK